MSHPRWFPGRATAGTVRTCRGRRGPRPPAGWRVLTAALVAGVLTDLALQSGAAGIGAALLVAALAGGLLGAGRPRNRQAWLLAGLAVVFGAWLAVRTSPWLLPLDVLAAAGLLVAAAALAHDGSVADLRAVRVVARGRAALRHGLLGASYLAGAVPVDRGRGRAALAGAAVAVPVVGVLGALLASADPVFASFLELGDLRTHLVLFGLGAWAAAGLLRLAAAPAVPDPRVRPGPLDPVAALVVLGAIDLLFAAFAAAQLVAAGAGGARVLETAGLTYAEYARGGFFQLLAVAALTVATLLALRAATRDPDGPARRRLQAFQLVALALTLALVAVALRRLGLYVDVFGLTMLRLYSTLFSVWIGVVLVLLGLVVAGVGRGRHWLAGATAGAGLAILLGLNIVNPEALATRYNLDRGDLARGPDVDYVATLSDDAVPTAVAALPGLDPATRASVLDAVDCAATPPRLSWAAANLSRIRADLARRAACPRSL